MGRVARWAGTAKALVCGALALFGLAHPAPSAARDARATGPALWQVRDTDTTIYLFGTIHALREGGTWLTPMIARALDASDTLVTELGAPDEAAIAASLMSLAVDPDGPPVSTRLSSRDSAKYKVAMDAAGIGWQPFESFDPWFAGLMLSTAPLMKAGYQRESGVEQILIGKARQQGKAIAGLETADEQFAMFDSLSEDDQIAFLSGSIKQSKSGIADMDKLVTRWAQGDVRALGRLVNKGFGESDHLRDILLTARNGRWADWITKRMAQPGTVFIAVGAGHLAGKDSVQAMLGQRGLVAERILASASASR